MLNAVTDYRMPTRGVEGLTLTDITEKASKLPKFYDLIQAVELILEVVQTKQMRAEVVVVAEHKNKFVAAQEGEDLYGCIDLALHKMQMQLTSHKERFRNRKHPA